MNVSAEIFIDLVMNEIIVYLRYHGSHNLASKIQYKDFQLDVESSNL